METPNRHRKRVGRTGLTIAERDFLAAAVDDLIADIARRFSKPQAAIARQVLYRVQSSAIYGGNPTSAQKRKAYKYWKGICQQCMEPVELRATSFHHVERDLPDPHQVKNLKPFHDRCHDEREGVRIASLRKGSPRRGHADNV